MKRLIADAHPGDVLIYTDDYDDKHRVLIRKVEWSTQFPLVTKNDELYFTKNTWLEIEE